MVAIQSLQRMIKFALNFMELIMKMKKVLMMRPKIYLLRDIGKIPLILVVDPMRGTHEKVKENQEANRSPS